MRNPIPLNFHRPFKGYKHDTVFKEVSFNEYQHSDNTKKFLKKKIPDTKNVWQLYKTIKRTIEKLWIPSKFHIVGASSGYDSRIIANAIKELRMENGKDWFGKTLFIEVLGEGIQFKKLIEALDFDGFAYNEKLHISEQHEHGFDFRNFYKKFNGINSFPINHWFDVYTHLEQEGIIDSSNVQCFTGYGANETQEIAYRKMGFEYYFKWHHYIQLQTVNFFGGREWEHPYWNFDVLNALRGLRKNNIKDTRIAIQMAEAVTPHLNHIKRISLDDLNRRGKRTLSDRLLKKIQSDYDKSWYGKKVPVRIGKDFTDYRNYWTHYCIASLCEHLLEQGYKIEL